MNHSISRTAHALAILTSAWAFAHCATAQEAIPLEEARRIAQKLASIPTGDKDQPFIVNVDAFKPVGIKGGDAGVLLLPDNRLNTDALTKVDKAFTPIAQFWTYKVTMADNGKILDRSKVRIITVSDQETSRDVQFFLLGAVKNEKGEVELVAFSKGSEPVLRVPLAKGGADHDFPIEISARGTGDNSAALTLNLPGQYTVDLSMVKVDD